MVAVENELVLNGIAASPGIAIGRAYLLTGDVVKVVEQGIDDSQVEGEIDRFLNAIEKTKNQFEVIQKKAKVDTGLEGEKLFDVYRMLLEDSTVIDETISRIRDEKINSDYIYYHVMRKFQQMLESSTDDYFAGRATDIRDVKRRVIRNIQGKKHSIMNHLEDRLVIVARELTPIDTVQLDKSKVLAFITDAGGRTSHAAIMAQSMQIPSVVGLKSISSCIRNGDMLIVDGTAGKVIILPSDTTLEKYEKIQQQQLEKTRELESIRELPSITKDGKSVELSANLEFPEDMIKLKAFGANGIGLYRSEYLYLTKDELPSEEEQFREYDTVAKNAYPQSVIFRTLDIGGDKKPRAIEIPEEENPFLGLRGIRLTLHRKDLFRAQIRAILRASSRENVKILFPMLSSVGELIEAKKILTDIKQELIREKIAFDQSIDMGAMIEVPSAGVIADLIAKEVDFLSIGTNDLIQYLLAVDRGNEQISHLYKNYSIAVFRMIKNIVDAGHRQGVWVGMCGEMAGDPFSTLALVGMGLDELSVTPAVLPKIKKIIRSMNFKDAQVISERVLQFQSSDNVEKFLIKVTQEHFGDIL
jgi:phosphotransferase system enzyme I (PtsI)